MSNWLEAVRFFQNLVPQQQKEFKGSVQSKIRSWGDDFLNFRCSTMKIPFLLREEGRDGDQLSNKKIFFNALQM